MMKNNPLFTTLLLLGWSMNAGPCLQTATGATIPSAAGQPTSTLT